jgi:hypothetical protein
MAIQMGAITLVGLLAGIAPLVRVGSFVVGDPRHRRAEIGTGVAMLILNLSAAADVFIVDSLVDPDLKVTWQRTPVSARHSSGAAGRRWSGQRTSQARCARSGERSLDHHGVQLSHQSRRRMVTG